MRSARKARQADRQIGNEIGLVVACFLAFRLLTLLLFQYGGIFGNGSDFDYYYAMAQQTDHGVWPYLSYWSEYPPVFPWLIVAVYRFAALFGGSPSGATFIHLLHVVLLTFDVGNLLLIYALSRRIYGQTVALRSAWVYTTLFAPIFVWLGWFDPLPVFCMLLSVWLLVRRNYAWAGLVCGLGIVTKIFPGFVLLVALREVMGVRPSRTGIRSVLSFAVPCAVAVAVVCIPLAVANPVIFTTSVRSWFSRLPWESFWAIADGYYLFGIVPSLPARVGWPTYTTPSLSSGVISAASLLVLAISVVGAYLFAWDGTPALAEEASDFVRDVRSVNSAFRRLLDVPISFALRGLASAHPSRPKALAVGLEVAGGVADERATRYEEHASGTAILPTNTSLVDRADEADYLDERAFRLVAFTAALYTVVFLVTSGYSPQFMLWMVPFAVILLPSLAAFAWVTAFSLVVLLGERYLYYWYFPPNAPVLSGLVLVRSILLAGFLGEVLWLIGVPRIDFWPRLRRIGIVVTGITMIAVGGFMLKTFANGGWGVAVAQDPARLASSEVRQATDQYDAVLTFSVSDYRWLAPWLGDRALYLVNEPRLASPADVERTMRSLAHDHSAFVVVERGPSTALDRTATNWLARYGTEISSTVDKTGFRATRYEIAQNLDWPASPPTVSETALFGNEIELLGYSMNSAPGTGGNLTLNWKPLRAVQPADLVLVPDNGTAVVGQIGTSFPPTTWPVGQLVVDVETVPAGATTLTLEWRDRASGRILGSTKIRVAPSHN